VELTGPTKDACRRMEKWQLALQCIASEDGDLFQHLGPWGDIKNSHQNTEWNLDAGAMTL
jgi:hypothetical protein